MKTLRILLPIGTKRARALFLSVPLLFVVLSAGAQGLSRQFRQLSRPEKMWVIVHPFSAKKAWKCTTQARTAVDSLQKAGVLSDGNGGQLDAFRHSYWMALLVQNISPRKAAKLGKAHEKGNYLDFKKGKGEETGRADSLMSVMDLRNNAAGIEIGKKFRQDTAHVSLEEEILHAVWDGKLTITKKDAAGNFLDCAGKPIDLTMYDRKWYLPKCLVPSNMIEVKH